MSKSDRKREIKWKWREKGKVRIENWGCELHICKWLIEHIFPLTHRRLQFDTKSFCAIFDPLDILLVITLALIHDHTHSQSHHSFSSTPSMHNFHFSYWKWGMKWQGKKIHTSKEKRNNNSKTFSSDSPLIALFSFSQEVYSFLTDWRMK